MKVLLELFSGIGGFAKGLADSGHVFEKHYFSEVDKHAVANYKYNFPNAEHLGSVTTISGANLRPDIITFGSPCQDFSLAGLRAGLGGERSSLISHAIRLIGELRPSVFVWENVKGVFSSNDGADFWAIVAAFANIGGYECEWQLLNTSWFLPQNRERIYLVGHLAERSRARIFPISEADRIHNQEHGAESGQIASTLNAGDNKSWVGNFIHYGSSQDQKISRLDGHSQTLNAGHYNVPKIVASRGRNPENKSARIAGQNNVQTLEERNDQNTNCLTSVQKDNLVSMKLGRSAEFTRQNKSGLAYAIDTEGKDGFMLDNSIRRLTEIECERLQGYPDNWTEFGIYEKMVWLNKKEGTFKIVEGKERIPKTQRYKMIGNAVSTPVVKIIGTRLKKTA